MTQPHCCIKFGDKICLNYIGNMHEFALFRFMCMDNNVLYGDGRIIWSLKKTKFTVVGK